MIREANYFEFNGIRSTDFNIRNVSISGGLYQESFLSNRTINEVVIRGKDKPYLFDVTKDPLSFQLSFFFEGGWDDDMLSEVVKWLDVDCYKPLFFDTNIDKVYYCMPVSSTDLMHNGLREGYVTLTMRCDSPYAYSRYMVTDWYNCTTSSITFELMNMGHKDILPFFDIVKVYDGDITITNMSRANSVMAITSLHDKEELTINGENEIIQTSLPNTYRYDNFNDFYLPLYVGNNIIQVTGLCKLKLEYRFKYTS
jgi:phage-related protein